MTEEEGEDSDPGGTSVLRVSCVEYVLGLEGDFQEKTGPNTLSIIEGAVAYLEAGNQTHPTGDMMGGIK